MNPIEQLLLDDLYRLSDRIAIAVSEDTAAAIPARDPELHTRLEASSARLAELRVDLADRYATWEAALTECEELWARAESESRDAVGQSARASVLLDRAA